MPRKFFRKHSVKYSIRLQREKKEKKLRRKSLNYVDSSRGINAKRDISVDLL